MRCEREGYEIKKPAKKDAPVERLVMKEIRAEFTANAVHFDSTMVRLLEQNERLIEQIELINKQEEDLKNV